MTMKVTRRSQIPGSRFSPTNVELVNILSRRIERKKRPSFITDIQNLYEKEPWLLQHVRHHRFKKNEWFYFVKRKKPPGTKKPDSKRPSRKVVGSGRWKTTGSLTQINDKQGAKVGFMQNITFKAYSETEKDGITTGWVMHEFLLDKPGFQEVVLCRIRFHPGKDNNAQYAPRLEPTIIGQPQPSLEDSWTLVKYNKNDDATGEDVEFFDVPVETQPGMDHWFGPCSVEVVSLDSDPTQKNQDLEKKHHSQVVVTYSVQPYDPYLGQNNESTAFMETQEKENVAAQDDVPLMMNQTMEEQDTDVSMNQCVDDEEPHGGIVDSLSYNYLTEQSLGDSFYKEMDSDMSNFGDEEWVKLLGENTPEEEAELRAALEKCKTPLSLINYFCPNN
ncbi:unnamed protein product [Microthlaspi erraticum]|uniref:NAC domain-containing protein n=1 Tax=Microthlaspi erraticum TaxID=1685480 RepID=A0A6D2HE27_9BRAS|nr:unnamed protein product [Microthlaspi erraticum]